ncbi:unnamed protein product [Triticum turgidum subsp. durum]|uniref:Uncharacterized protein n=1 Tax=Triticum turgidum subsp. durum TaxID=4567 RepID=A0A9R0QPW9_TRITD|nr:unnamed protein product [Triticum turgidum subsp. durum]
MVGLVGGGARAWRLSDEAANGAVGGGAATEADYMRRLHGHAPGENQCTSALVKHIKAPVHLVWSLVRSFDQPQRYKPFVSRCVVRGGDLEIGSVREVNVKTGLPATTSTERLEQLDDDEHILSVKFVGGDHRLRVRAFTSRFLRYFLLVPKCSITSLVPRCSITSLMLT